MVDIIEATRVTSDDLPLIGSAQFDNVTVHGFVDNQFRTLFEADDDVIIEFTEYPREDSRDQIIFEVFPYGGDNDLRISLNFFDGNGNYLGTYESNNCGTVGGCELAVSFTPFFTDFYLENVGGYLIQPGRFADVGDDIIFDTEDLLVTYGIDDIPSDWTDRIGGNVSHSFIEYPSGEYCEGDELNYSFEITNDTLQSQEIDVSVTAMDNPSDSEEGSTLWIQDKFRFLDTVEGIELDLDETVTVDGSFNVQRYINEYHPDKDDNDFDIPHLFYDTDGAGRSVASQMDDFEISVNVPDEDNISVLQIQPEQDVFVGDTYNTSVSVGNVNNCSVNVDVQTDVDGSPFNIVEEEPIGSDETIEVSFDRTAPDSSGSYSHEIRIVYGGSVVSDSTYSVNVIGETDVIDISNVEVDGSFISGNELDIEVQLENTGPESVDVDISANGTEKNSTSVRSNRTRDVNFTYELPEVDDVSNHEIDISASVDGEIADSQTESVDVRPLTDAISITDIALPASVSSGETISSRDATIRVESEVGDVYVDIEKDGERLVTHNISRPGTDDIGIEFDAPVVDEEQNVDIEFYITIDGDIADSGSSEMTVTGTADVFSIDYIDAPSEMLSGEVGTISVGISNDSDDTESVSLEYGGETVARDDVRGGRSNELEFEFEAPEVDDRENVSININAIVDGTVVDSGSESIEVNNIGRFINIEDINAPDSIFGGEIGNVEVLISNSGDEEADIDIEHLGEVVDSSTIRSGRESRLSFEFRASEVEESVDENIEVVASLEGDIVDRGATTIRVDPPTLSIDNLTIPSSTCIGTTITVDVAVSNPTGIDRDGFLTIEGNSFGSIEREVSGISGGRDVTESVDIDISQDVELESDNITVVLEYVGDSFIEVDSQSHSISVNRPNVHVDSIDVPERAAPGEVVGSVSVRNDSMCDTDIDIMISGESNITTISSESTQDVDVAFDIGTSREEMYIEVVDEVSGEVQDSREFDVTPINYMEVDTESNSVDIVNGYNNPISIEGQAAGRGIEVSENIRSEFDVLPNVTGAAFDGEIEQSDDRITIVSSEDLRFINIQSSEELTWVVDGEIEGKSKSFRYRTAGIEDYMPEDELSPRRPRTVVSGGLLSGIGLVRYRLGIK